MLRVGKGEEEIQQMRAVVEVPEEVTISEEEDREHT